MPGGGESQGTARGCGALQGSADDRGGPRAGGAAAEVDVLGEAGPAVAEVVGDLAGGQAGLVEPGGPGLAARVRGGPGEAGPVEGRAQVAAGVARIAEPPLRAGEGH